MTINYSDKIILITSNNRLTLPLKQILAKHSKSIANEYINLHSIPMIQKAISRTQKTVFIRTELVRFIRETGYPFIIALDYKIDSGIGPKLDPDRLKILRSFLISFIILSRGKGFANIKCNLLLLTGQSDYNAVNDLELNPLKILETLNIHDKIINSFIEELRSSPEKFNSLFFIKSLNMETDQISLASNINNFINGINARENLSDKVLPKGPEMKKKSAEPAKVIYVHDQDTIYINGEKQETAPEGSENYEKNQFYISGYWTTQTLNEVSKEIHRLISKGFGTIKFDPKEKQIINITDECRVDASTTANIAQLAFKDLQEYQNIRIGVSIDNIEILQKSKGFSLIKKIVQRI